MALCNACPRSCSADRDSNKPGYCGMGNTITIARAALHFWEEPCISGEKGSGTVFFSGCSLKCVYCQNYAISHELFGAEVTAAGLMKIFDSLIEQGAHNINLVTPTHYAPLLADVLEEYRSPVPVAWNSGGYESVETLKRLEGLIDIYMPDIKFFDGAVSKKYAGVHDYFEYASKAVLEMQRQTGILELDENGIALSGMLVRHLVLPGNVGQTVKILQWVRENLPENTAVSLMSQYTPCGAAAGIKPLDRKITKREYNLAVSAMLDAGFENGYVQELSSAGDEFIPPFNLDGLL